MSDFDPAAHGWREMKSGPMPAGIGIPWAKRDGDSWRYGMVARADHCNPQGAVHGGVLMTFLDQGLSMLVWSASDRAANATIQLNTHFMDAVKPGDFIELRGTVLRRTASMVFIRGTLSVGDQDVAAADGIWRIFKARDP